MNDLAEGVGFEPTNPDGLTVFKTVAFVHSAIPPRFGRDTWWVIRNWMPRPAPGVTLYCIVARTPGSHARTWLTQRCICAGEKHQFEIGVSDAEQLVGVQPAGA